MALKHREAPGSDMPAIEQETCDVREAIAVAIELQRVGEFGRND
jgi:hypothetical protein